MKLIQRRGDCKLPLWNVIRSRGGDKKHFSIQRIITASSPATSAHEKGTKIRGAIADDLDRYSRYVWLLARAFSGDASNFSSCKDTITRCAFESADKNRSICGRVRRQFSVVCISKRNYIFPGRSRTSLTMAHIPALRCCSELSLA